ncbi:MAG: hypothetical protein ACR2KG_05510 [Nocardioidaceae bacterium]
MGNDDLGSPEHGRSGLTIDEAVETAEEDSQVAGMHTPSGQAASGESRVEQMPEVHGADEPRVDGDPGESGESAPPGPGPSDIGSGGAQRIEGARISDREAAGEATPDGPPFHDPDDDNPPSGAGAGSPEQH